MSLWAWLAVAGVILAIACWTIIDRRKMRRRRAAIEAERRGLTLPEFVDSMSDDGIAPCVSAAIYMSIARFSGVPSTFRFHPDDALAVYFDDDEDVFDMACELLAAMGAPKPTFSEPLDISWWKLRDMASALNERAHISRTDAP